MGVIIYFLTKISQDTMRVYNSAVLIPISSKRQNCIYIYSSYCASQYLIAVCALWCTHLIIFSININYIIGITLG